jgi:hypothetical protein
VVNLGQNVSIQFFRVKRSGSVTTGEKVKRLYTIF